MAGSCSIPSIHWLSEDGFDSESDGSFSRSLDILGAVVFLVVAVRSEKKSFLAVCACFYIVTVNSNSMYVSGAVKLLSCDAKT